MEDVLILRKLSGNSGWQIVWRKPKGLNKGDNILATTCGGHLGAVIARAALEAASNMTLCTDFIIED